MATSDSNDQTITSGGQRAEKPAKAAGKRRKARTPGGGKPKGRGNTRPKKKAPRAQEKRAPSALVREGSKRAAVVALLERSRGATLAELMEATGWQPHSVRGFISGTLRRKAGLRILSARSEDGQRSYTIAK